VKILVALILLVVVVFNSGFAQQSQSSSEPLSSGENRSRFDDVYFIDYPAKGIQVSYNNTDNSLHTVYFYNGQRRYENFAPFQGRTNKGVDWKSSPGDVIKVYGKPKEDYEGPGWGWRRLVFEGIDFRFENGTMVRIGIPGK
jgi:hypothetical protein